MLVEQLQTADVFVGSYEHHREYLSTLGATRRLCLIKKSDIRPPKGTTNQQMLQNMLQWLHLDNVLKQHGAELSAYTHVVKLRFDTRIETQLPYMQVIHDACARAKEGVVFCNSDRTFHATTPTFMQVFENFYDNRIPKWPAFASERVFKLNIKEQGFLMQGQGFKTHIDRGSYFKERADGNRKLYAGNDLKGKFC